MHASMECNYWRSRQYKSGAMISAFHQKKIKVDRYKSRKYFQKRQSRWIRTFTVATFREVTCATLRCHCGACPLIRTSSQWRQLAMQPSRWVELDNLLATARIKLSCPGLSTCSCISSVSFISLLQHSNCSTPSTPPYSQTLALENQMVGPMSQCLVGGNGRQHLPAPAPPSSMSMTLPTQASASVVPGKRTRKHFVDPCSIAPLKKRRIQVKKFVIYSLVWWKLKLKFLMDINQAYYYNHRLIYFHLMIGTKSCRRGRKIK